MATTSSRAKGTKRVDKASDIRMQEVIRRRADYSLAVLGKAFVGNGSGRFLNIRTSDASASTGRRRDSSAR